MKDTWDTAREWWVSAILAAGLIAGMGLTALSTGQSLDLGGLEISAKLNSISGIDLRFAASGR